MLSFSKLTFNKFNVKPNGNTFFQFKKFAKKFQKLFCDFRQLIPKLKGVKDNRLNNVCNAGVRLLVSF